MSVIENDETAKGGASGVRSVQRAVEILALLSEDRPVVSLSDIVRDTGLAKTTVVRMVHTLEQNGLVWTTAGGITAGPGLWRWAYLAHRSWELPVEVRQLMRELADATRETVNLYVRRDVQRVCLAQQQGTQSLRHVVQVGDELPLWAGASGKVLLMNASPSLLARAAAISPEGAGMLERLRVAVDQAGEDGYVVSHGEREIGVSAIAVPLLTRSGTVGSALAISGPTVRFTDGRIDEFRKQLERAATQLTGRGFTHPFEN
jgi:DNA-binding IclR family transcriptional regulator